MQFWLCNAKIYAIILAQSVETITPVPKDCNKINCQHEVLFNLHFVRREMTKIYDGKCPECGETPKAERKNSKISKASLMKTHIFFQCNKYKYGQKFLNL